MADDRLAAPVPTEEHRRLAAFAGEWNGEETVYPSRWVAGGPATARVTARIDLNGFYLIQDTRQFRDGKETFATHAVFTYDREDRALQIVLAQFARLLRAGASLGRLEGQDTDAGARLAARQRPSRL